MRCYKNICVLYPSNGLQDLIGACVRFETHIEIGAHARKSNEGLYTVQGTTKSEPTLEEVTRAARRLGFGFTPLGQYAHKTPGDSVTIHQPSIEMGVNNSSLLRQYPTEMTMRAHRIPHEDRRL